MAGTCGIQTCPAPLLTSGHLSKATPTSGPLVVLAKVLVAAARLVTSSLCSVLLLSLEVLPQLRADPRPTETSPKGTLSRAHF